MQAVWELEIMAGQEKVRVDFPTAGNLTICPMLQGGVPKLQLRLDATFTGLRTHKSYEL